MPFEQEDTVRMANRPRPIIAGLVVAAALLAACGGSAKPVAAPGQTTPSGTSSSTPPSVSPSQSPSPGEKPVPKESNPPADIPYSTAPIKVTLTGGNAVVLTYQENSEPNPVTGKQYRLEVIRFDFYNNGEEADLILSGPLGADNVDPWTLVAQSFRWK